MSDNAERHYLPGLKIRESAPAILLEMASPNIRLLVKASNDRKRATVPGRAFTIYVTSASIMELVNFVLLLFKM